MIKIWFFLRVPCRSGSCTSPMQVTAAQLVYSKAIPHVVVQALLYPGACFQTLLRDATLPQWSTLLQKYSITDLPMDKVVELNRLEVCNETFCFNCDRVMK